jgi:hypothetical protein
VVPARIGAPLTSPRIGALSGFGEGAAMNDQAAKRLRIIGFGVVLVCVLLLWLPMMVADKIKYDDAIASTLAIGIGLLLLSEIGPLIKTLKAGGIEVEFLDSTNDKFNALHARVARLEMQMLHPERDAGAAAAMAIEVGPPPALLRPVTQRDDPQKGRWGGEAKRDGFRLSATFRNVTKSYVEVLLRIDAPPSSGLADAECVEFYLHDSFDPDVVPAVFHDHVAELSLLAYGGFTVGAWIGCRRIELELDLAKVRGAPRIIRDL